MIRRFGRETLSTYCQTLNGCEITIESIITIVMFLEYFFLFVDRVLVSRIGDAG